MNLKIRTKSRILAWILAVMVCLSACAGAENQTAKQDTPDGTYTLLTFGTADSGGSMYAASASLAILVTMQDENVRFNINASTGSRDNIVGLLDGRYDLAFASADALDWAGSKEGRDVLGNTGKLRAVAAVYPSISCWMAKKDSGIRYVHDLKEKKVSVGPENSSTYEASIIALGALGIEDKNGNFIAAGLGSGAEKVAAGEIDAVHGFAGLPIPGLALLAGKEACTVLKYSDEELDAIAGDDPNYFITEIPAGTYEGQDEAVATFGTKCILCVSEDADDELVYHLTELIMNSIPEFGGHKMLSHMADRNFRIGDLPVPLHKGAERWYEEHPDK